MRYGFIKQRGGVDIWNMAADEALFMYKLLEGDMRKEKDEADKLAGNRGFGRFG